MTKKNVFRRIRNTVLFFAMLAVLWCSAHINYNPVSVQKEKLQSTEETEEIWFPDYVEEKISDGLVFDAEVITGDTFDANHFYESTAILFEPDMQKWKQFFGVDDTWEETVYETKNRLGNDIEFHAYTDAQENSLYLTSEEALWARDDMVFLYNVLDTNEYSPRNNAEVFSEKTDLSFATREENWKFVLQTMEEIGIDKNTLQIHSEYDFSAEKLREQEKRKIAAGDIEEREKKGEWFDSDEAYYYCIDQITQGLPVYSKKYVNDYFGDNPSPMIVCTGAEGIRYLSVKWYFLFDFYTSKVQFASFDKIKECIVKKYGKTLDNACVTVKKMRLGVYPLAIEKERNKVVPVWICTLEKRVDGSEAIERIYLPIDAVTGEEFYDMEG